MHSHLPLQDLLELPVEYESGEDWKYDHVAHDVSYGYAHALSRASITSDIFALYLFNIKWIDHLKEQG